VRSEPNSRTIGATDTKNPASSRRSGVQVHRKEFKKDFQAMPHLRNPRQQSSPPGRFMDRPDAISMPHRFLNLPPIGWTGR
jgi:hypothetical protein